MSPQATPSTHDHDIAAVELMRSEVEDVENVENVGKCQSLHRYRRPPPAIPVPMAFGVARPLQRSRKSLRPPEMKLSLQSGMLFQHGKANEGITTALGR